MPVEAAEDAAQEPLKHAQRHRVTEELSAVRVAVGPLHRAVVEALSPGGLAERQVAAAGEGPHATSAGARQARDPGLGAACPSGRDAGVKREVDRGEVEAVAGALVQLGANDPFCSAASGPREAPEVVGGNAGVQEVRERKGVHRAWEAEGASRSGLQEPDHVEALAVVWEAVVLGVED